MLLVPSLARTYTDVGPACLHYQVSDLRKRAWHNTASVWLKLLRVLNTVSLVPISGISTPG